MSDGLQWLMSLEDKMSEPASQAESKLEALERRLHALARAERETADPGMQKRLQGRIASLSVARIEAAADVAAEKHKSSVSEWVETLDHGLGVYAKVADIVTTIARTIYGIAEAAAGVVVDFARMGIAAAEGKEIQVAQLRALTGSKAEALELVEAFDSLAAKVKFTGDETQDLARKLLAAGGEFTADKVPTFIRALSDAAAATGATAGDVDTAVSAMMRANTTGKFTEKTMVALTKAGIPASKVYEVLAKDLGTTAEKARELVKAGKVDANEGLWAMVGGVAKGRSGNMLGSEGESYTKTTLAGLRKNFTLFKEQIFDDLFNGSGMGNLKGFWSNVNDAINPDSAGGQRIRALVTSAFDRLFVAILGPFQGQNGVERIEGVIRKAVAAVEALVTAGRSVWAVFEGMTTGVLDAFGLSVDQILGADGALSPGTMEAIVESANRIGYAFGFIVTKINLAIDKVTRFSDVMLSVSNFMMDPFGGGGESSESEKQGLALLEANMERERREKFLASRPTATAGGLGGKIAKTSNRTANVNVNVSGGVTDPRAIGEAAKNGTEQALAAADDRGFALGTVDGS